jgi:hypothetical protein
MFVSDGKDALNEVLLLHTHRLGHNDAIDKERNISKG